MLLQNKNTKLCTCSMNKVLAQAAFCVSTRRMEINYIFCHCVFLFISSLSAVIPLVLCLKKFNSISNSLPGFSQLCLSLSWPICKGSTMQLMKATVLRLPSCASSCSPMLSSLHYFPYFLRSSLAGFFVCLFVLLHFVI